MSGTQWIYLEGIDCFEPLAIGILVLVDNGRQTEQGILTLRVSDEMVGGGGRWWRTWRGWGPVMERERQKKKRKKEKKEKMGISSVMLSSSHVTSDSNPQKTKGFMGIFCYAL